MSSHTELEPSPGEGEVTKMDCSFRHTCTEQPHPRPIVDAQVGGHTITTTVDTGCLQTIVHTIALPAQACTPAIETTLVCMQRKLKAYEQCQLPVMVLGKTHKMLVGISGDLLCPMVLGQDWQYLPKVSQDILE